MTQTEKVLDYMKRNGGITTMEAFSKLKITRLSGRIFDLKAEGYNIASETIVKKNKKTGETTRFARYYLEGTL